MAIDPQQLKNFQPTDNPSPEMKSAPVQIPLPSLRTYKSDVAQYIKTEGKTLADIAIAESQRHTKVLAENRNQENNFKKILKIAAFITGLALLTFVTFWLIFSFGKTEKEEAGIVANPIAKQIFVSGVDEKTIALNNETKEKAINEISRVLNENSSFAVARVTAKDSNGKVVSLSARDFLEKVDIYPPDSLIRALSKDFALGSIGGRSRFIVFKINYYSGAFAGMLSWEKNMEADLRGLLSIPIAKNFNGTTTPQSGTTTPNQFNSSVFTDAVISNRDARMLRNQNGVVTLLYIFPDNETILIATNENTVKTVKEKLLRGK